VLRLTEREVEEVLEKAKAWYHSDFIQDRATNPEGPPLLDAEVDLWNATRELISRESTARMSRGSCTRCQQPKARVFFINQSPKLSFAPPDFDALTPPRYEASCKACLTDREIATMLAPIAKFVVEALYLKVPSEQRLLPEAGRVYAALSCLMGMDYNSDCKQKALEALT